MRWLLRESHLHFLVRSCKGKCFAQEGKRGLQVVKPRREIRTGLDDRERNPHRQA
jgi:hypothetical protein